MASNTKKLSSLIESQLPGFISSEYENFSKFVEKYYEQLESRGQALDVITNIEKYKDINFYEKNILKEFTSLTSNINSTDTTIQVEDTSSFPETNGYLRIGDEICFYKSKTPTQFLEVSRGVSGNTTLGDLYEKSSFVTTNATNHYNGDQVLNISNLFLYALVKNFESEYLGVFPEKYLKEQVDKRTLIKNIQKFYRAKGTDASIKFIFNSIISKEEDETPVVFYPKDNTIKPSTSDWITKYSLKVKVIEGNPESLIGERIEQIQNSNYASAVVDNVIFYKNDIYEIILNPSTINNQFVIPSKTKLTKDLAASVNTGGRIDVESTLGWNNLDSVYINNEVIKFSDKNVNQFVISQRGNTPLSHSKGSDVFSFSLVEKLECKLIILGVLYNLNLSFSAPYAEVSEKIEISDPGFETSDPVIFDRTESKVRWLLNSNNQVPNVFQNNNIFNAINNLNADVSAIYEDDQYYYVCSSGFPSHQFLNSSFNSIPQDQKLLRLIRKTPTTTTEIYETPSSDVGIFVNGVPAYSCKDEEFVLYGNIIKTKVTFGGSGYKKSPFVLINGSPGKAVANLSGEIVESISIVENEIYQQTPTVTITAGRNAKARAIVTSGEISRIIVTDPGEFYSSPPQVRIIDRAGKGNFAEYEAVISDNGQVTEFKQINPGRFYTEGNVIIEIIEDARNSEARAEVDIRRWYKNRYTKNQSILDDSNGYLVETNKGYGYGYIANPRRLRGKIKDNLSESLSQITPRVHSPILGYAYDGNPIYGPYGYEDPLDKNSSIIRLLSGYNINSSRQFGPSTSQYPIGTFVDDYTWEARAASGKTYLDENNGRFCVTPDYPNGVYAYFITVNDFDVPVFPYILGKNYYSLPVDSNYNSNISQDNLPESIRRLRTPNLDKNGLDTIVTIDEVNTGQVKNCIVEKSTNNFKVGCQVRIDNKNTEGSNASAVVSSILGEQINYIESVNIKPLEINTVLPCYLFAGDKLSQPSSGAYGEILGDVFNNSQIILRNVVGQFNSTGNVSADIQVLNIVLNNNASFTKDSIISLIDINGTVFATGIILETITRQNTLRVRVTSGEFITGNDYTLRSSNLFDTIGVGILSSTSLSKNLQINNIDEKIAIARLSSNHNLKVDDKVNIDIIPSDADTETTYFVRKRIYQKLRLNAPELNVKLSDSGIGRFDLLNGGVDYASGVYQNVELIFRDSTTVRPNVGAAGNPNNARATIQVSNINGSGRGRVISVTITSKGKNYKRGDILTVSDVSLGRLSTSISTQRLILVVDHVGFSKENTILSLSSIINISLDDELLIGEEIVKVTNINTITNNLTVLRGVNSSNIVDHYNGEDVTFYKAKYRFNYGSQLIGSSFSSPFVFDYVENTQELNVVFNYGLTTTNVISIKKSNVFYDNSSPQKLVSIDEAEDPKFVLQFSQSQLDQTFVETPNIDVIKHYKYRFDTSHFSMGGTYLSFSPSLGYNIVPIEIKSTDQEPGQLGSSIAVKFGYAPELYTSYDISDEINDDYIVYDELIVEGDFIVSTNIINSRGKKLSNFSFLNYYYFDKGNADIAGQGFISLKEDPLQGQKTVYYTTDTSFVYKILEFPQYDGMGDITFTTSSQTAIGKINTIAIENGGENYKRIPIILGVDIAQENEALLDVGYDFNKKSITYIDVIRTGQKYSKPRVVVTNGDGRGAKFSPIIIDNTVVGVNVLDGGKGYTYKPTVKVIESDVKLYFESDDIGTVRSLKFVDSGYNYHKDFSLISLYNSPTILLLKNHEDNAFFIGEKIVQTDTNGTVTFSAKVAKNGWRPGSNILRIQEISGVFDKFKKIKGTVKNKTADVISVLTNDFIPNIKSYSDNIGYYNSDRGKLSNLNQRLTDSYYYQDYSYGIKSKTPIDLWRDLIKETIHPAGFQLFGEILIESDGQISMPSEQKKEHYENIVYINLRAENVEVKVNKRYVTESILNYNDSNVERGVGSACVDTRTNTETIARELILASPFNGEYDKFDGQRIGTKTFTLLEKESGLPYTPYNNQQLIITLDGVIQEPGVAYNIIGNQITFSEAPIGTKIVEGQTVFGQKFYCRSIKFKKDELNERYLKKLKPIDDQFDGIETTFDLYYEDNSIVKTDFSETLLVFLNGVLQKSKELENIPYGNSYHIIRSQDPEITDKIQFTNPPINHEDLSYPEVSELDNREKCFIYSIGNYKRLTVDPFLIPIRGNGSFNIVNEVSRKIFKIEDPRYALVFIDGVLQIPGESYEIIGSSISFTKSLNYYISESGEEIYPDVSILFFYGRDLDQQINVFDFEPDTFYNKMYLTLEGENIFQTIKNLDIFPQDQLLSCQTVWVYQSTNLIGELKEIKAISDNEVILTVFNSVNINDINTANLSFLINKKEVKDIQGEYTITLDHEKDSDGTKLLTTGVNTPIWIFNTEYGKKLEESKRYKKISNIIPGDFIKLDGENEYREVFTTPDKVYTKNYLTDQQSNSQIYASIQCSNYNGITRGEGLTVTAEIFNGKVVNIIWNKRDLEEYLRTNILLQPTAYQYFTNPILHFIPTDGNGGGARAEVIIAGGQVLDVVIVDSGEGYTSAPEVVVARKYSIIKKNSRKIVGDLRMLQIIPKLKLDYSVITEINIFEDGVNIVYIFDILSFAFKNIDPYITRILTPDILNVKSTKSSKTQYTVTTPSNGIINSIVSINKDITNILELDKPKVTVEYDRTVKTGISFTGIADKLHDNYSDSLNQNILGNRLQCFETSKFAETGYSDVSKLTIEEFNMIYPESIIQDFDEPNTVKITSTLKERFNLGYSSIQNFGAYLDISINASDTVIYISNTSSFPSQGKLLVGDEIVSYEQKSSDRFLNVTRGVDQTRAKSHEAGSYLRSF
ncbi:MAG: YHYH protein [Saprospiraceae bacterium]